LPFAGINYIGMQRDEHTAIALTYYKKLLALNDANIILINLMLATDESADYAIHEIERLNPRSLSFCCVIVTPERITPLNAQHSAVLVSTIRIHDDLDAIKLIVSGFGDFGDQHQGTDSQKKNCIGD
jgi:uracil phosphoribosyltransferase